MLNFEGSVRDSPAAARFVMHVNSDRIGYLALPLYFFSFSVSSSGLGLSVKLLKRKVHDFLQLFC